MDGLTARYKRIQAAFGGQRHALQHCKLEVLQAGIETAALYVQSGNDLNAEVTAATALAAKIFAAQTSANRVARMQDNKASKKRALELTQKYDAMLIPTCIRGAFATCLDGQLNGTMLALTDRVPEKLLYPTLWTRVGALGCGWFASGFNDFAESTKAVVKSGCTFLDSHGEEDAIVMRVKWNHEDTR